MTTEHTSIASLNDIRALLDVLPAIDGDAQQAAILRNSILTKPAGALAQLEELAIFVAGWQGKDRPTVSWGADIGYPNRVGRRLRLTN
mgnify:CR=1 FL=1